MVLIHVDNGIVLSEAMDGPDGFNRIRSILMPQVFALMGRLKFSLVCRANADDGEDVAECVADVLLAARLMERALDLDPALLLLCQVLCLSLFFQWCYV
jgi:hypothetical protein